jgi:hypothetical protein
MPTTELSSEVPLQAHLSWQPLQPDFGFSYRAACLVEDAKNRFSIRASPFYCLLCQLIAALGLVTIVVATVTPICGSLFLKFVGGASVSLVRPNLVYP